MRQALRAPSSPTIEAPPAPPPTTVVASGKPVAIAAANPLPTIDASVAPRAPRAESDTTPPPTASIDEPAPDASAVASTEPPPDIPVPHGAQIRSLAAYEKRVKSLEEQMGAAEARGDTQEIERLKPMLEAAKKRVALLRAELGG